MFFVSVFPHKIALKILHEYIPAIVSDGIQGMDFLCDVQGERVWLSSQQSHI